MASPLHVVGQLCSAGPGWVCHLITRFDTKGALNGRDMREQCLLQRKRRLRRVVPTASGCLLYADHIVGAGRDLFALARE